MERANRLSITESVVRGLLDPNHETKNRQLAAALAVLGKGRAMVVVPRNVI